MFGTVIPLLERDLEHVTQILNLFESYIILGGAAFVRQYGAAFPSFLMLVFGRAKDTETMLAVRCVHTLLKVLSGDDVAAVVALLEPVLKHITSTCVKCDEEDRQALAIENLADRALYRKQYPATEPPAVVVSYLSLLTRVFVQATQVFMGMLSTWESAMAGGPRSGLGLLAFLVGRWTERYDEIAEQRMSEGPWYRKLCCMALLCLLPVLARPDSPPEAHALLRERLIDIVNCGVDLLMQLSEDA